DWELLIKLVRAGYRPIEIIGRSFAQFYPAEDRAAHKPERELEIAARDGQIEDEGWRVRRDGSQFWANVLITARRDERGELIGFAKLTRDLTERRAARERELANARRAAAEEAGRRTAEDRAREMREFAEKLQQQATALETRSREAEEARAHATEANRVKGQFLAAMSHELRTPLNAIGGYASLLAMGLSGPVTPQQAEHLERIKLSQAHLLGVINDILNFSRIEAGQLAYDLGPVPLSEVIDAVMPMITPQAQTKGLHVEAINDDTQLVAWADRAKIEQIVLNLVSNAVKFTGTGGAVRLSYEQLDAHRAALHVSDTGCGIPDDQLATIFEPFVQVGRSLISMHDGTGLGLAISRDLARAMNGDIIATSRVDVGSTFTLTLPLRQ
ncbi:MAG: ATP-binding protein, partial [bacterium]